MSPAPSLFDVTGRVAVVTGGNGGIGRAIAMGLGSAGAAVAVLARNEQKNAATLAQLRASGISSLALQLDVTDRAARTRIALEHQTKALKRARQFAAAMDVPGTPPESVSMFLVAGDAVATDAVLAADPATGVTRVVNQAPGDGDVLRSSALMDERLGSERGGRLKSPIGWTNVLFLSRDHLDLTKDPAFTDNLLFFLYERPKNRAQGRRDAIRL